MPCSLLHRFLCVTLLLGFASPAPSAEPTADLAAWKPIPRRLPAPGKGIKPEETEKLQAELARLKKEFESVKQYELAADAEVYLKAVELALKYNEFYNPKDAAKAEASLKTAADRIAALKEGKHPWTEQRGTVVRGYYSSVDGSPQPYGMVIPKELDLKKTVPLYIFLHGRGENETDLHFMAAREKNPGEIHPPHAIVIHPFGRQCMGYKSAGETDVLEAVEHCQKQYSTDPKRVVLTGFSMGGGGAWLLGSHHADHWAAVSPGAGYSETRRFQRLDPNKIVWYEKTLWGHNDATDYVRNLFNTTVVAYSGETDGQIQAARVMEETYAKEGQKLNHVIGPNTGHQYERNALKTILEQLKVADEKGKEPIPTKVTLQTRSLRYARQHWVEVLGMEQPYAEVRVEADYSDGKVLKITAKNATALRVSAPSPKVKDPMLTIDGQTFPLAPPFTRALGVPVVLEKAAGKWTYRLDKNPLALPLGAIPLHKEHSLSGPIDDAFYDSFLVVLPSGKSKNPQVQKWVDFEMAHLEDRWQSVFRGKLRTVKDTEVTEEMAEEHHLLLWGDPSSNAYLAKVLAAKKLPIEWSDSEIALAGQKWDAKSHVPVLIYPNPLYTKPVWLEKYVVINSGPTWREHDDNNNASQNPKLPDWAVLDITSQPTTKAAGVVVDADFFDSHWKVRPMHEDRKAVLKK